MKNNKLPLFLLLNLAASISAFAANTNIAITGTVPTFIPSSHTAKNLTSAPTTGHYVMLEHIKLSDRAQAYLASMIDLKEKSPLSASASTLPTHASVGMNGVPVLDQGRHGTCVTFADTGALNAALGHSDYISQLCNLDLGTYLEQQDASYPSGWDGSWNQIVLDQVKKYGIVSMSYQIQNGCGSPNKLEKAYPLNNEQDVGSAMSVDVFSRHSEKIMDSISYNMILSSDDAFSSSVDMNMVLTAVKTAVANGDRVVFGTLIDVNGNLGQINGAAGTFKVKNDSWILTPQIAKDAKTKNKIQAGHALIITGYDDTAEISGPDGNHQGVLTLRNSWGADAGNSGEYYMSYDYFLKLVMEVEEIKAGTN